MNRYKLVLFDLDGTLIDTDKLIFMSYFLTLTFSITKQNRIAPAPVMIVEIHRSDDAPIKSKITPPARLAKIVATVVTIVYRACPFTASPFSMISSMKETIAGRKMPKDVSWKSCATYTINTLSAIVAHKILSVKQIAPS